MTEVERIQQRIRMLELEQSQAERNWQRCDGALQVLRGMLGEAQAAQLTQPTPEPIVERMNGTLPEPAAAGSEGANP